MAREDTKVPAAVCSYPIAGWRLQRLEYDDGKAVQGAPAWVVELKRERPSANYDGPSRVLARSLLGMLEAWDDAVACAVRISAAHPSEPVSD